ncbi:peptidoglycan recognition protein family protein [Streptosporangium sp. NBC_01755]|uniref:peptidoglycan recognition protein family protein n=1 Tax=Streptosporangium sp. NBC_01755 TaxID=2975949 RepID=UPI002DD8FD7B|nr:peptidoglycan recognition family protein [Streptosporangium sp. NBC_01755]WSD03228.1 peptidoglycan recognition protein family protein [Streptosporangium sp. NBC_01755]
MKLVNRGAFGWGPSDADPARPREGLVIHYDGSDQGLAGKAHSTCVTYWQNTRKFHMGAARGWADIGYSFGCCPHGYVFEGRGLDRVQAAQPGGNSSHYSVTLMSGPGEDPTAAQVDAVRQLRVWLMSKGMGAAVKGHRDFFATSCPGDRLYALVRNGTFTGSPAGSTKEDDVSAKDMWTHELPVPFGSKENPEWQAGNVLVNAAKWAKDIRETVAGLGAKLDAQGAAIKALVEVIAARDEEIDVEALVARIESAIEGITVRLNVPDAPAPQV